MCSPSISVCLALQDVFFCRVPWLFGVGGARKQCVVKSVANSTWPNQSASGVGTTVVATNRRKAPTATQRPSHPTASKRDGQFP